MRLAIVSPNYYPQTCGVGDNSMRLGSVLLERGLQVGVFTRTPAEPHPSAPQLQVYGFACQDATHCALTMLDGVVDWGATRMLIQYTPQMLEAFRLGSPAVPLLAYLARRRGIGVTVIAHELFNPWSLRPNVVAGALGHRLMLAALIAIADNVLVTTNARQARLRTLARLVCGERRLSVVRIGPNALPILGRRREGSMRLGTFSTLTIGKRFDLLLDAFSLIASTSSQATLTLIGALQQQPRRFRFLQQAVNSHPFRERILLTGGLDLPQLAHAVSELDVFLHTDALGAGTRSSTLPTALGCGVPVVALAGTETDALFRADENIVFADSLSAEGFASAVMRLLRQPALARKVSRGGRHLYDEHLSWEAISARLLEGVLSPGTLRAGACP